MTLVLTGPDSHAAKHRSEKNMLDVSRALGVYTVNMGTNDTHDRILDHARDLFIEKGLHAVTMRAVASRTGITPMAIYRHFSNRDAMLRAIIAKGHEIFMHYLQRSLAEPTAWDRLTCAGDQYLDFALENPRDYEVMFMTQEPGVRGMRGPAVWQDAATYRFLVDRIRDCVDAGFLSGEPEEAGLAMWAQVHGLVSLYLAGKLHVDEATFRRLYARTMRNIAKAFAGPRTSVR